jgi:hypothetical protein
MYIYIYSTALCAIGIFPYQNLYFKILPLAERMSSHLAAVDLLNLDQCYFRSTKKLHPKEIFFFDVFGYML